MRTLEVTIHFFVSVAILSVVTMKRVFYRLLPDWPKRVKSSCICAINGLHNGLQGVCAELPDILRRLLDWMLSSRGSKSKMEPGSVLHTFRSSESRQTLTLLTLTDTWENRRTSDSSRLNNLTLAEVKETYFQSRMNDSEEELQGKNTAPRQPENEF